MTKTVLLFISLIIGSLCFAQTVELITDRPDQTESAVTVPQNALQIETGFVVENKGNDKSYAYNTTLLRYGLLDNFELRLGAEYLGEDVNNQITKGFSPLYAGFKLKIKDEDRWKPEIAFLGALIMPFTADPEFEPNNTAANMRFAFAHTLNDKTSLSYNIGAQWDGVSTTPAYFYSLALGVSVSPKIGAYLESYGNIIEKDQSEYLIDAGLTYLLSPIFQLDISTGLGLNDEAIDNFLSFGLTYRFT